MIVAFLERVSFVRAYRVSVWTLCADLLESGYEIEHALPLGCRGQPQVWEGVDRAHR